MPTRTTERLLLSAAHKSSGKTTVTVGLLAALTARGLRVQSFKKGPDFIDPMWLGRASGRPCHNIDPFTQSPEEILSSVASRSRDADFVLVEGTKGLHDGVSPDGSDSNASVARLLGAPVVLVIDTRGMTRGIAPLLLGFQSFDPEVAVRGVILNRVGGPRHEEKLRTAVGRYTNLVVLGAVPESPRLALPERHLGLQPSNEFEEADHKVRAIGEIVGGAVDLDAIQALAASAPPFPPVPLTPAASRPAGRRIRLGIARDRAFGFYYPADLEALSANGAELVFFDTLRDPALPAIDALLIGGGFPELFLRELEANASMRESIRAAIDRGMPAYAECGGLMYLSRSIAWGESTGQMVGAIPGDIQMTSRPVGRGYAILRSSKAHPWFPGQSQLPEIHCHEFHYSEMGHLADDLPFAYDVLRGSGIQDHKDGVVVRNLVASYTHLRDVRAAPWTQWFLDFARSCFKG